MASATVLTNSTALTLLAMITMAATVMALLIVAHHGMLASQVLQIQSTMKLVVQMTAKAVQVERVTEM
jgi:hypothetical protein